jgi:hypothetical protein
MKKFLIIFGIFLLIALASVWTYIFLYGVPKNIDEVFARFSSAPEDEYVGNEHESIVDLGDIDENETTPKVRLYQLTTRPVAGATFVDGGIRYVERGTGHMYEIGLQGGSERIISATTHPRTIRASFSPNGDYVALVSDNGSFLETTLGTLTNSQDEGTLDIVGLPENAREAAFSADGTTLYFFVPHENGGTGYAYSIAKQEAAELFTIPLTDVHILWGDPTYVFTTPSAYAMGYIYAIGGKGELVHVTKGGKGLSAFRTPSTTLVSTYTKPTMSTYDVVYGDISAINLFTEKCTAAKHGTRQVYCASPIYLETGRPYPDDWYKGVAQFTDEIFLIDRASTTVALVSSLEKESGRPIDILMIGSNADGTLLYFVNKYDGSLWMLDLRGTVSYE